MNSGSNVTKFRKRKSINVGFIVFLIIFVYVVICVYLFFTKDHLSIYEVKEGSTSDDTVLTGFIVRDEQVVSTDTAGYINYYHKDGDRIAKNSTVYSIDESKYTYDQITNNNGTFKLTSADSKELQKEISIIQKTYQDISYSRVYDFKYDLKNTIMDITNDSMLSNLKTVLANNDTSSTFRVVASKASGIITYYVDNMENVTAEMVTAEDFNLKNYKKTGLRSSEIIEKNSPVYKIIKDDNWSIILLLNKNMYHKLTEKESVNITFTDDGLTVNAPVHVYEKGSKYYARLDMDKYMIRYLNQRFVTIDLAINSAEGLKIPVSSIVKKDFYLIPLKYFTVGGNSSSNGLNLLSYDKDGNVDYDFIPTDIYYSDENYGYVDTRLFEDGTWISSEAEPGKKNIDRYQVSKKKTLKGVFNVNKGYATFRRIEVLYENEEYCIVKKDTQYGLSVYDHIALDGKTAVEQAIIY